MAVYDRLVRQDGLTEAEQAVARYLVEHPDDAVCMSMAELARASLTSNSTIVRLCRKVGVDGFRDLRLELAADLERRRRERSDVDVLEPVAEGQGARQTMSNVANLMHEAVSSCYEAISPQEVRAVAHAMTKARHVLLYGKGDSYITLRLFAHRLLRLGFGAVLAEEEGDLIAWGQVAAPGDVAVFATYSGRLMEDHAHLRTLDFLKRHGCTTVAVTAQRPYVPFDRTVALPADERVRTKLDAWYEQACMLYALNCVAAELYELSYDATTRRMQDYDRVAVDYYFGGQAGPDEA